MVEPALRVIQCESLGDPEAYNPYSGASGLFQFLPGTWAVIAPKAGFDGVSVFDPEANIGTGGVADRLLRGPRSRSLDSLVLHPLEERGIGG